MNNNFFEVVSRGCSHYCFDNDGETIEHHHIAYDVLFFTLGRVTAKITIEVKKMVVDVAVTKGLKRTHLNTHSKCEFVDYGKLAHSLGKLLRNCSIDHDVVLIVLQNMFKWESTNG